MMKRPKMFIINRKIIVTPKTHFDVNQKLNFMQIVFITIFSLLLITGIIQSI